MGKNNKKMHSYLSALNTNTIKLRLIISYRSIISKQMVQRNRIFTPKRLKVRYRGVSL